MQPTVSAAAVAVHLMSRMGGDLPPDSGCGGAVPWGADTPEQALTGANGEEKRG
ncbi:hypothetical protein GCM10018781_22430 [Kitasatospora indigofera]|uniref:Uncharacterized protein n=1 Tax=Kitasatospora indigofera TaxID=67307 RepID=A0A919FKX1_9ACTN|nr:hypothetical protein GCM10018781_22430 [Kitasatospora indigofera]